MTARYARGILALAGFCFAPFLRAQGSTPLQIITDSLPAGTVGTAYNQQIVTAGGTCLGYGTGSSLLDAGALPPGLIVTSPSATEQWFLQGTPTIAGTYPFTIRVRWSHTRNSPFQPADCSEDAVKAFSVTIQGGGGGPIDPPPPGQSLYADRSQVNATYRIPHFPPSGDTVQITSGSGTATSIAVAVATDSGGSWMNAAPQYLTTPTPLFVTYAVGGLAPGTYTGRVTVSASGLTPLVIPVTLVVSVDSAVQFLATPAALTFTMTTGGADPAPQSSRVAVTSGDNAIVSVAVTSAPPNGKWLTVSPSTAATPVSLTIGVSAKDLPVGVYNGAIQVNTQSVSGATLSVPVTFTIQAPPPKPTITAGGVVDAAGGRAAITPGAWVSLFGTSLAITTRAWKSEDIQNGKLPTTIDGVTVTIDGKAAPIAFVSPTQVNVLAGDDATTGLVPVVVKNSLGTSDSALVVQQTAAPSLFQLPGTRYAAAVHASGALIGPQAQSGTPAQVGETIVLFGTGFGATDPAVSATALAPGPQPLAHPADLRVRIGLLDAAVAWAGLISPGLYQFNVVVPQVAAGDQAVTMELRGLTTQTGVVIPIKP